MPRTATNKKRVWRENMPQCKQVFEENVDEKGINKLSAPSTKAMISLSHLKSSVQPLLMDDAFGPGLYTYV